ncbi:MAG: hypothetical protein P1V51_14500 [Deltaproteobacteria bacterium]|nr:hypothetical protein [Deltaproteobacteria bacterium]
MSDSKNAAGEQIEVSESEGVVKATFPLELYDLDDIYGAAYTFIDRSFVYLDLPAENRVQVTFRPRNGSGVPEQIAGDFANELLAQAWRRRIAEHNRPIIEAVAASALSGAVGGDFLDDFDEMDFSDDAFDDPLGIALSWEEKYGKSGDAPKEGEPASPPEAPAEGEK